MIVGENLTTEQARQQKREERIHRAIEERKNAQRKSLIRGSIIVAVVAVVCVGVGLFIFGDSQHGVTQAQDNSQSDDNSIGATLETGKTDDDLILECMQSVPSKSAAMDVADRRWFPTAIAEYNAKISCADRYPDTPLARTSRDGYIKAKEEARKIATSVGMSQSELDATVKRLDQEQAEQDAETAKSLAEWQEKMDTHQKDSDARRAELEAQQKALQEKMARCAAWEVSHGSKTYAQAANDDAKHLKAKADEAQAAVNNIRDMMAREPGSNRLSEALKAASQVAQQAQSAWMAEVNRLTALYRNESGC